MVFALLLSVAIPCFVVGCLILVSLWRDAMASRVTSDNLVPFSSVFRPRAKFASPAVSPHFAPARPRFYVLPPVPPSTSRLPRFSWPFRRTFRPRLLALPEDLRAIDPASLG